jgi:predicted ArsR family transcriptional regulator
LEEAGLVTSESRRGPTVGRPQTVYEAVEVASREDRGHRLLADVLAGLLTTAKQRARAEELAREWGAYLVGRSAPRPGARRGGGPNLAVLQQALAEAGFTPRFHRTGARSVEISLRDCPFRDLLEEHRELVCSVHRGLLTGILAGARPPLTMTAFDPLADRSATCRLSARL